MAKRRQRFCHAARDARGPSPNAWRNTSIARAAVAARCAPCHRGRRVPAAEPVLRPAALRRSGELASCPYSAPRPAWKCRRAPHFDGSGTVSVEYCSEVVAGHDADNPSGLTSTHLTFDDAWLERRLPRLPPRAGRRLFGSGRSVQFGVAVLRQCGRRETLRRIGVGRAGLRRRAHRFLRAAQRRLRRSGRALRRLARRGGLHVGQQDRAGRSGEPPPRSCVRGHTRQLRHRMAEQLQLHESRRTPTIRASRQPSGKSRPPCSSTPANAAPTPPTRASSSPATAAAAPSPTSWPRAWTIWTAAPAAGAGAQRLRLHLRRPVRDQDARPTGRLLWQRVQHRQRIRHRAAASAFHLGIRTLWHQRGAARRKQRDVCRHA